MSLARLRAVFGRTDRLWTVCALAAAVLVTAAAWLPLWEMEMHAPQYPKGLMLTAYGSRLEGDLDEVNELNHYVGIGPIHPDDVLELQIFPYAVAALVAVLVIGAFVARHRIIRLLLVLGVWALVIGFLADLQFWLYRTGHNVVSDAPIRPGEFTPKVVGTTRVLNFENEAMVVEGFWLILAAALVISFGPWLTRFLIASWNNTGEAPVAEEPAPPTVSAHRGNAA